ncbi:TonB family protein [Mucilaginibacter oryzae]|uniref:TonB family protein n=1 Tax=Mucilaginibacter oryzae TaxID=468058 RepID=A0A316HDM6_9SPHI|nr:M56 family metallopeptidase [Mucilaginibacter oryzae]PWK78131.1 TonB family protein [Mucilaginibacter oryzae]
MNWLYYLLEANLYLCVFYACYCLFLNKETHYTLNRAYLLLSCVVSFIIPVVQIGWLKPGHQPAQTFIVKGVPQLQTQAETTTAANRLTTNDVLIYAYIIGVVVLAALLIIKFYQLLRLTKLSKTRISDKYKLVNIEGTNTAFSFFNYLFIGTKTAANHIVIKHELVHIRQKHSADIVFLELIKIINWFNPFIYLLQISLKTIHEYIADEQTAAEESDAISYSSFLVSNAYGLSGSALSNSFFNYNLLKKRIIMLNQKRSGKLARLKYLAAVPISCGLLCASTLVFSKTYGFIDLLPKHQVNGMPTASAADTNKTATVTRTYNTSKGYKFEETGYLNNGKTDYRVMITEKNGEQKEYYKSKTSPEELAMLKNKYGYTFPDAQFFAKLPPPPPPVQASQKLNRQVPPPPPAPPKKGKKAKSVEVDLLPPPPPPANGENVAPPPPPPAAGENVPPPPPPADPFYELYRYIGRYTRYPAKARENHLTGRVILTFNINNGKISDVKLVRGVDESIDNEVLRVLNQFDGNLAVKSGFYSIPVYMGLQDANDHALPPTQPKIYQATAPNKPSTTLREVVVIGYGA